MDVTLLGTGSPVPTTERAGTGLLVSVGDEPILVDCGGGTVRRLLETGIDLATIETLFFTHHHVDHNADFFGFVLGSWSVGRESLSVYGPEGTEAFVEAVYDLYEDDIAYREWFGHDPAGISDIEVTQVTDGFSVGTDSWSVTALSVEHSIETYAYRVENRETGQACVFSGDTRRIDSLAEFASGADLLIQDTGIAPVADDPPETNTLPDRITRPLSDVAFRKHKQNHCDPADAGTIAAQADVGALVLTHLLPHRDLAATREQAATTFDGEVIVGRDGLTLSL